MRLIILVCLGLVPAACSSPSGTFPSLAVRSIEQRPEAVVTAPSPPVALNPELPRAVAEADREAADAIAAFDLARPDVEQAVSETGPTGSESWIAGQLAINRLIDARGRLVSALTALDGLVLTEYGANRQVPADTPARVAGYQDVSERQAEVIERLRLRLQPD